MEKFKRFADAGTGINPFVPFVPKPPSTASEKLSRILIRFLLGPILLVLRGVLLFVLGLLYMILGIALPSLFVLIPPLSRAIARTMNFLLVRSVLFVCGFLQIKCTPWPFYAIPVNAFAFTPAHPSADPLTGRAPPPIGRPQPSEPLTLILSNHCSYIDVLFYTYRYSPLFAFPAADVPGSVFLLSPLKALRHAFCEEPRGMSPSTAVAKPQSLSAVLQSASAIGRPVVLFAEGTTTNGRSVLQFDPSILDGLTNSQRKNIGVQVMVLQYPCERFSPCLIVGPPSPWRHLCQLLQRPYHSLSVKWLRPNEVPALPETTGIATTTPTTTTGPPPPLASSSLSSSSGCAAWLEKVRTGMTSAAQIKAVALRVKDKTLFLEQWEATQAALVGTGSQTQKPLKPAAGAAAAANNSNKSSSSLPGRKLQ